MTNNSRLRHQNLLEVEVMLLYTIRVLLKTISRDIEHVTNFHKQCQNFAEKCHIASYFNRLTKSRKRGKTGKEKQTSPLDLVQKSVDVLKLKWHTVVAKSLRPKSIFVCEATCSAVLHQKSFATVSSFLVSESVAQQTVSSHKQSTIQQWGCFFVIIFLPQNG